MTLSRSGARPPGPSHLGSILFVLGASAAFSINDLVFKLFSGDYPLHQMMFVRSAVALTLCAAVIVPLSGGRRALRTRRARLHLLRGSFLVVSNIALYTGLAVLHIADTVAIFFAAPLMITGLSVVLLGERVGIWRWLAVVAGLTGVLLIVKPGGAGFTWQFLLPVTAAFAYAMMQIMTRGMGMTERAATLFFYNQLAFVVFSAAAGLSVGGGRFADPDSPALDFLFRAWVTPPAGDMMLLVLLGVLSAGGGYMMTLAYRQSPSNIVAPFEYVALLMAVIWGYAIWNRLPDIAAACGIVLIVLSGLGIALREARLGIRSRKRHMEA